MKNLILIILSIISLTVYAQQNRLDVITVDTTVQKFTDGTKIGYVYQKGDSIYSKVHDSIFLFTSRLQLGHMHLSASDTTQCTTADYYYKISKTAGFVNGVNNNFTIDGNGKITFTGIKGTVCLFLGASDVTADKQCQITYALYKNGSLYANAESVIDINNPGKAKHISINLGIPNLKSGDYFEVYCKTDVANTIVTHNTLFVSFIGDR